MKKSILIIAILAFTFNSNAYVVSSTNGYDVNIELNLNSLNVASGCSGGWYNYGINYSYDISFSGVNAPNSLWTLQATSSGQDGSTFISLPNNGGIGNGTSSTVTRGYSDCQTATPSSLGYDTIYLKIQGPGISNQTIPLHVTALPVELLNFTAKVHNSSVALNWSTASELNNHFFTIEKSIDGFRFDSIQTVYGAGNSNNVLHYSETDKANLVATYYRLKQTDFDGTYSYSNVVLVKTSPKNLKQVKAYPNPNSNGTIKVDLGESFKRSIITVKNINGQIVQTINPLRKVTILERLPRGIYVLTATNTLTGEQQSLRLIQQ